MKVYVDYVRLSNLGEELTACERTVKSKRCGVESIAARLTSDSAMRSVKRSLNELCQDMEYQARSYKALGDTAKTISRCYKTTESNVLHRNLFIDNIINIVRKIDSEAADELFKRINTLFGIGPMYAYEIDSIVFDETGDYGGDQGNPLTQTRRGNESELYDIIKEKYPSMPEAQYQNYLKKLENEGCGYVAMVNTIFVQYEGREEQFEETFGFPMYDDRNKINYDRLMVDLYASTDNHYRDGKILDDIDYYHDYNETEDGPKDNYSIYGDTTGAATTESERKVLFERYLKDHGVVAHIETGQDISARNIESRIENGEQIIVSYHLGNVYNMDGTVRQEIEGGHAMEVTGVTQEGYYIVSTWGDKCYIDPNEVIEVTDDDGNINETSMTFSTVEYD